MYVSAANLSFNPYDVARDAGLRIRVNQQPAESASQKTPQPERLVQGEVLSRQKIQNSDISSTNDTLANRQFNQQQSGLSYNARQAVNTYIANQFSGEAADQKRDVASGSLVDVYV
ncbi:MAG: hypothetical protein OEY11_04955 [Gammaproteobacteria bacterium]|nr:hypothetical protein [Gammaproteobacteria bacterium]